MITKGEINETRVLLDEQNEKNELLERKFRKVDSELMEVIIIDNYDDIIDHYDDIIDIIDNYDDIIDNYDDVIDHDNDDGGGGGNDGWFLSIPRYSAHLVQNHDNPCTQGTKPPQSQCFMCSCQMSHRI